MGVNPWVAARSEELYGPSAAEFRPERWLSMSREERTRVGQYTDPVNGQAFVHSLTLSE